MLVGNKIQKIPTWDGRHAGLGEGGAKNRGVGWESTQRAGAACRVAPVLHGAK